MTLNPFEIVFAVPLECGSCVDSVANVLKKLDGVEKFDINLKDNLVTTEGSLAPSEIAKAIQSTGRDAIIRGTGKPNSAAVCILSRLIKKISIIQSRDWLELSVWRHKICSLI